MLSKAKSKEDAQDLLRCAPKYWKGDSDRRPTIIELAMNGGRTKFLGHPYCNNALMGTFAGEDDEGTSVSPKVKHYLEQAAFTAYLRLVCIVLSERNDMPDSPPTLNQLFMFFMFFMVMTLIFSEYMEFVNEGCTLWQHIGGGTHNFWNFLDFFYLSVNMLSFILRATAYFGFATSLLPRAVCHGYAWNIAALNVVPSFLRYGGFLTMNHDISQLIELVKQIMYDNRFINFLAILVFVLISFAITTSTMTSMNTDEGLTLKSFFEQVEILFWALTGDTEKMESAFSFIGMANWAFLLVVQIILLNGFLLALLNDQYASTNEWAVEMQILHTVKLIWEYQNKLVLPPVRGLLHGLSSNEMALITSNCDAVRSLSTKWP